MKLAKMEEVNASERASALPAPVQVWCGALVALWCLCLGLMSFWRYVRHLPYPYRFPFFPVDHLYDIWCFTPRFHHAHSVDFFSPSYGYPFNYPAPTGIFYLWEVAFGHPFVTFFSSAAVGVLACCAVFAKHLRAIDVPPQVTVLLPLFTAFFSYTLWYEGVQANVEIFLFFLLAGAIAAFLRGRYYTAAILFGIAASMKIFPLALLGLFIPQRRWRELIAGLLAAVASTIAGLWMLCPDIPYASQQVSKGLAYQRDHITLYFDSNAIGFDHSLFAWLKLITERHFRHIVGAQAVYYPASMFRVYLLAVALLGVTLWLVRIRKLPLLNQIACLTLCAILFPPTSYEYTLLHMYVPWMLLVLYTMSRAATGENVRWLTPYFVCFAVVFGPVSEVIFMHVNLGACLKSIALSWLLYGFLCTPMPGIEEIWNRKRHAQL